MANHPGLEVSLQAIFTAVKNSELRILDRLESFEGRLTVIERSVSTQRNSQVAQQTTSQTQSVGIPTIGISTWAERNIGKIPNDLERAERTEPPKKPKSTSGDAASSFLPSPPQTVKHIVQRVPQQPAPAALRPRSSSPLSPPATPLALSSPPPSSSKRRTDPEVLEPLLEPDDARPQKRRKLPAVPHVLVSHHVPRRVPRRRDLRARRTRQRRAILTDDSDEDSDSGLSSLSELTDTSDQEDDDDDDGLGAAPVLVPHGFSSAGDDSDDVEEMLNLASPQSLGKHVMDSQISEAMSSQQFSDYDMPEEPHIRTENNLLNPIAHSLLSPVVAEQPVASSSVLKPAAPEAARVRSPPPIIQPPPNKKWWKSLVKTGEHTIGPEAVRARVLGCRSFRVELDPSVRSVTVDRNYISKTFGGSTMALFPEISHAKRVALGNHQHHFLFPNPLHNPDVPKAPGEPGLLCRVLDYIDWDGRIVKLLVRLGNLAFLYLGDYCSTRTRSLSQAEFSALPQKSQKKWVQDVKTKDKYRKLRARISFRREYNRQPTEKELETKLSSTDKFNLEVAAIVEAFVQGHDQIHIWRLECVGYDEDFQRKLAREYPPYREEYLAKAVELKAQKLGRAGLGDNGMDSDDESD